MLRALLLALALPGAALAQVSMGAPGSGSFAPGGYTGMPASPNLAPPEPVVPRHRYDPAYPTRGLPVEGGGVPRLELSPAMRGVLIDRAPLDRAANPPPAVPLSERHLWVSGIPYVVDGDSLGLNGELIRLAGIDAPEVDQLCYRGNIPHRCGIDSRAWLAAQIEDKRIDCRIHHRDGAQRLVSTCWSEGRDIGGQSVRAGWALVWAGMESPYGGIEEEARSEQAGMWAFDFRHPAQWRSIMDDERKAQDGAMAAGDQPTTKPFPYIPFTQRHAISPPAAVYDATRH